MGNYPSIVPSTQVAHTLKTPRMSLAVSRLSRMLLLSTPLMSSVLSCWSWSIFISMVPFANILMNSTSRAWPILERPTISLIPVSRKVLMPVEVQVPTPGWLHSTTVEIHRDALVSHRKIKSDTACFQRGDGLSHPRILLLRVTDQTGKYIRSQGGRFRKAVGGFC